MFNDHQQLIYDDYDAEANERIVGSALEREQPSWEAEYLVVEAAEPQTHTWEDYLSHHPPDNQVV